jgi:hypothetical protein
VSGVDSERKGLLLNVGLLLGQLVRERQTDWDDFEMEFNFACRANKCLNSS